MRQRPLTSRSTRRAARPARHAATRATRTARAGTADGGSVLRSPRQERRRRQRCSALSIVLVIAVTLSVLVLPAPTATAAPAPQAEAAPAAGAVTPAPTDPATSPSTAPTSGPTTAPASPSADDPSTSAPSRGTSGAEGTANAAPTDTAVPPAAPSGPPVAANPEAPAAGPDGNATGAACAPAFAALFEQAKAGTLFPAALGAIGQASSGSATATGTCDAATGVAVREVHLDLFGSTLEGTGLAGSLSPAGLCLTSGSLTVDADWGPIAIPLTGAKPLCVPIGALTSAPVALSVPTFPTINGLRATAGSTTFTVSGAGLTLAGTGSLPVGGAGAIDLQVGATGDASGTATVSGVAVFGTTATLAGALAAPAGGPLTGAISADVAGPLTLTTGVKLSQAHLSLDATGLAVAGTVHLAGANAAVHVAGRFVDARNWALTVDTVGTTALQPAPAGWLAFLIPHPGGPLTLDATVTGTFTAVDGVVGYDVTAGSAQDPVGEWVVAGQRYAVSTIRFGTSTPPAACGAGVGAGHPWMDVTSNWPVNVDMQARMCVDMATGGGHVALESAEPFTLAPGVTLSDLRASISWGAAPLTMALRGTVTTTTGGTTRHSTLEFSSAPTNPLVLEATVDLSDWGVGQGTGKIWYAVVPTAKHPAGGAFGTIDLPAGLSVGTTITLSPATYRALTEAIGVELGSPSVTVFASLSEPGTLVTAFDLKLAAGRQLILNPGGSTVDKVKLTIADGSLVVDVQGRAAGTKALRAHLTIAADGSVTGSADVAQLPVFGVPLDFHGTLQAPAGGALRGALEASIAGPVPVASGLSLSDLRVRINEGTAFGITGSARVGGATGPVLNLSGNVLFPKYWALSLSSSDVTGWTPVPGLTLRGALKGTVSSSNDVLSYSLTIGSATQPAATWALPGGSAITLQTAQVSNQPAPASCGGAIGAGNQWIAALGGLVLPGTSASSVPVSTCVDLTTGAFQVTSRATAPVKLHDQVTLGSDLALSLSRNAAGRLSGTGHATVSFTAGTSGATTQSVAADLTLTADGALVVGAAVDLAQWGMGSGTGRVWFASAAVSDFVTGDPTIGTIDLPAGLTVGAVFTIPSDVYAALRDVVGLELTSRTLVGVGSVGTDGAVTARITVPIKADAPLTHGVPGGMHLGAATVVLTEDGATIDVDGTAGSNHAGQVVAHLVVGADGAVSGQVELKHLPVLGAPIDFTGAVSAPVGGPLTASFTADVAGPIAAGAVSLTDLHLTLDDAGVALSGTARLGGAAGPLVSVAGSITDDRNWTLTVTSADAGWAVVDGLTLDGTLRGTVSSVEGIVSFDVTAGGTGTDVAQWDLGHGNAVSIAQVRVSNAPVAAHCSLFVAPGSVWVEVEGGLVLRAPTGEPIEVPVRSCIDPAAGAFTVTATTTGPIAVTDEVSLGADLALSIANPGGGQGTTGNGHATVTFTPAPSAGAPQTVVADVTLRADGALIIGAAIDLAPWHFGSGTAHIWFATDAVPGFETGDAVLGTIDLPAGVTIGAAFAIPASAYTALKDVVGLQLTDPTVVLLASFGLDGSISATITVPVDPANELVKGVPGGVRMGAATLTITADELLVDIAGTIGSGATAGTASLHLAVGTDGAIDGHVELHGVAVLGQALTFVGDLAAPANGDLVVTLQADLAGPITVANGFVLSNLHVVLDATGFSITGDAKIAGENGPAVHVAGHLVDDQNWTLQVTSEPTGARWAVLPNLTLDASLNGTLRSTGGAITYEVTAGSPTASIATWDLGNGTTVALRLAKVANVAAPVVCNGTVMPGHAWLKADGALTIEGPTGDPVAVPVQTCIDLDSGAFALTASAAGDIALSDDVTLGDDLTLRITGDGTGTIAGAGHATVHVTVAGKAQAVVADLTLRPDGTLIVAGAVDLAQWDLGTGTGRVWFANRAVPGFETGDPQLGTIDLVAGVTVGVAVTIPSSAYAALTDTIGLDLDSPTIVAIGSASFTGAFKARATVRTKPGHDLIDGVPGGVRLDSAVLTVEGDTVTVDFDGSTGSGGAATAHLSVSASGAVAGEVALTQVPVFGQPIDFTGTVASDPGQPLAVSVVADVAGPLTVARGVVVRDLHLAFDPTGLHVSGVARIGGSGDNAAVNGARVHIDGHLTDAQNWTLHVSSIDGPEGWTVAPGLDIHAVIDGTITSTAGVVTFDLTAGTPAQPLATWRFGGANELVLQVAHVANTTAPATCKVGTATGDAWFQAVGGLSLPIAEGADGALALPVDVCINVTTGAFVVTASATAPIALGSQVHIAGDLALRIDGDGQGHVAGTGHATVVFTVNGRAQSVVADLELKRDGAFIIGATVDLAEWDIADGTGHVWFSTAAAPGFVTGDPAIPVVDLPAGLTAVASFEIPASAFETLRETVGLDLNSPVITVVASIADGGTFTAVATIKTKPGVQLVEGVPGGVQLGDATVTFTDAGVTVDIRGTVGGAAGTPAGTATAHLTVSEDGAVDGTLDLAQVPVFGHPIDLRGVLHRPAGGALEGSLTADVAGPIAIGTGSAGAAGLVLTDLHLEVDPTGLVVSGDATVGGGTPITARVTGRIIDPSNWSLQVSTEAAGWQVLPDLTINADVLGTVSSVAGEIRFDVAAGNAGAPLATWDLGHGNAIELTQARITNGDDAGSADAATNLCGANPTHELLLMIDGQLHASSPAGDPAALPVRTCIDLSTGSFTIKAHATGPIAISDQVSIDEDLQLTIARDAVGAFSGSGAATVTFTVDGKRQWVLASFDLKADGTLLLHATVDLSVWGLGQGTGKIWFSTRAIAGFDTHTGAGIIELPAGLTATVDFVIPEDVHTTLRDTLGLDLAGQSVTALAKITTTGSYSFRISVAGREDSNVLTGVPGGVRVTSASLEFTNVGVTVDAQLSSVNTNGEPEGHGTIHVAVQTDGSLDGHVELHDLVIFEQQVDFIGDVEAHPGVAITGSLKAELPGPIEVSELVDLRDIVIGYTPEQLTLKATAHVGEGAGAAVVQLDGSYLDPGNWAVTVSSVDHTGFQTLPGVTIHATFGGTIAMEDGWLQIDMTAGNAGEPLVDWDVHGNHVRLISARVVSGEHRPDECSFGYEGAQLWVVATGDMTFELPGGSTTATVRACIETRSRAFQLVAQTQDPIVISEQVSIDAGLSLTVTGYPVAWDDPDGPQHITGEGHGTVTFTVNGVPQSIAAEISVASDGTFVIGGSISLDEWGLGHSGSGHAWWSAGPVDDFDAGALGHVALPAGLTVGVTIPIPQATGSTLRYALDLPVPESSLTAIGSVRADGTFNATIRLKDISMGNLIKTPGGAWLDEAVLEITDDGVVVDGHGRTGTDDGTPSAGLAVGTFDLHLAVGFSGTIDGTLAVTNVQILGQSVNFSGHVGNRDHGVGYTLTAQLPGPIPVGKDIVVSNLGAALDSADGVRLAADVVVGPAEKKVTAHLEGWFDDDQNWKVSGDADVPEWHPLPNMTLDFSFHITAGMSDGKPVWSFGLGNPWETGTVFEWDTAGDFRIGFHYLVITNQADEYACPIAADGDVWIGGAGLAGMPGADILVEVKGCADITTGRVQFDLENFLRREWRIGALTVSQFEIHFNWDVHTGEYTFKGEAWGYVLLENSWIYLDLRIDFDSDENIFVRANVDLSELTGAPAKGFLFYTNRPIEDYDTGDPRFGRIDLPEGVSVAVRMGMPAAIGHELKSRFGVDLIGAEVWAQASLTPTGELTLMVNVHLPGDGVVVFRSSDDPGKATWLRLTHLSVSIQESKYLEIAAGGMLHLPAMQDSVASDLPVTAAFHLDLETGALSIGVSTSGGVWHDAFGIRGLELTEFGVELGIVGGIPFGGVTATVTGLPESWARRIGYQPGTVMQLTLMISFTAPVLEIQIGVPGGTTPVLLPGGATNPDALVVTYARLYIAPFATSIGGVRIRPGVSFDLTGTLQGSPMNVNVAFDPKTTALKGNANIPKMTFGGGKLAIYDLHLAIDIAEERFDITITGYATYGEVNIEATIVIRKGQQAVLDVSTLDSIPGIEGSIDARGTVDEGGHIEGEGDAQVGFGDIFKDAHVEMTDDGLLITFEKDGWSAVATLSFSGLDATLTKDAGETVDGSPLFKVGVGFRYTLRVHVDGGGFGASFNVRGYAWFEQPLDGWKHHELIIGSFTARTDGSEVCYKVIGIPVCTPFENPLTGGGSLSEASSAGGTIEVPPTAVVPVDDASWTQRFMTAG